MLKKKYLLLGIAAFLLSFFLPFPYPVKICLGITLFAAILWISEAVPLFLTSIGIAVLLAVTKVTSAGDALQPFFSPVVALLFGGFLVAGAVEKYGLDRRVVGFVLDTTGHNADLLLLGMMVASFVLSGFMSNSASAALMLPVGIGLLKHLKQGVGSNYSVAMMLGIAYAANVGGTSTIVGTPPNAMATEAIRGIGTQMSFLKWSVAVLPFSVLMLFVIWFLLMRLYPSRIEARLIKQYRTELEDLGPFGKKEKHVLMIVILAIVLWATEPIHGIHYGIVALIAAFLLFVSRLLEEKDVFSINWPVLLLVGGGLSLGRAIDTTGTAKYLINNYFPFLPKLDYVPLVLIVGMLVFILTNIASNTATTALFIPFVLLFSNSPTLVLLTAVIASSAFVLPVSTPPNALVYGSGYISIKEMVKTGLIITFIMIPIFLLFSMTYWGVVL